MIRISQLFLSTNRNIFCQFIGFFFILLLILFCFTFKNIFLREKHQNPFVFKRRSTVELFSFTLQHEFILFSKKINCFHSFDLLLCCIVIKCSDCYSHKKIRKKQSNIYFKYLNKNNK